MDTEGWLCLGHPPPLSLVNFVRFSAVEFTESHKYTEKLLRLLVQPGPGPVVSSVTSDPRGCPFCQGSMTSSVDFRFLSPAYYTRTQPVLERLFYLISPEGTATGISQCIENFLCELFLSIGG